ncbi:hypothetical protein EDC04DRAFT_3088704 [Pisolithus marmoratus]|nr:hypothetical protein EDC04DRAFT_3088704 [Pisolithus marmoratus]
MEILTVGIPLTLPAIIPVNLINREPGVRPPRFIVKRVEGNVYTLSINGYQTVELEGRLFGAVELPPQEWVITYRKNHDACTIVKRLDSPEEIGWIAPIEDEDERRQIHVGPLVTGRSYPPFYPPQELYRFEFPKELLFEKVQEYYILDTASISFIIRQVEQTQLPQCGSDTEARHCASTKGSMVMKLTSEVESALLMLIPTVQLVEFLTKHVVVSERTFFVADAGFLLEGDSGRRQEDELTFEEELAKTFAGRNPTSAPACHVGMMASDEVGMIKSGFEVHAQYT